MIKYPHYIYYIFIVLNTPLLYQLILILHQLIFTDYILLLFFTCFVLILNSFSYAFLIKHRFKIGIIYDDSQAHFYPPY